MYTNFCDYNDIIRNIIDLKRIMAATPLLLLFFFGGGAKRIFVVLQILNII